jgi:hypothetical protein
MPQSMERVEAIKSSLYLPRPEGELDAALGDPAAASLGAEKRV